MHVVSNSCVHCAIKNYSDWQLFFNTCNVTQSAIAQLYWVGVLATCFEFSKQKTWLSPCKKIDSVLFLWRARIRLWFYVIKTYLHACKHWFNIDSIWIFSAFKKDHMNDCKISINMYYLYLSPELFYFQQVDDLQEELNK